MVNLTIYQFDLEYNFIKRIEAKSADISLLTWSLKEVRLIDSEGKIISEDMLFGSPAIIAINLFIRKTLLKLIFLNYYNVKMNAY